MQEVISKKQYMLKLKPKYFLATRLNIFTFILCYFLFEDTQSFLMLYPVLAFLLYRFFFKENRLDNPYSIFLFEKYCTLSRFLRKNERVDDERM